MDGVIINSEPLHIRLEKQIFDELGITLTDTEHESFLGTSGQEMFADLKRQFELKQSVEELLADERRRYIELLRAEGIPFIHGIPELIEKLHRAGFKLALASSAPHNQIELVVNTPVGSEQSNSKHAEIRLSAYFQTKVSGDDVERSKPDPAIFLKAAKMLDMEPEDCWVIEDSENGIKAAIAAGMSCLGFDNPGSPSQDLSRAHHVISNINEASAIILG